MGWWMVAAAAAPYVIGALQKKPKRPAPPAAVKLPDRSAYINQILNAGFNTDSSMYERASDEFQEQVNRALAKQGLTGSGVGASAMISGQNKLAQSFIDEKRRRMAEALGIAQSNDAMAAQVAQGNAQAAYDHAVAMYNAQLQRQQAVAQGAGSVIGAIGQKYQYDDYLNRYDQAVNRGYRPYVAPPPMAVSMAPMPAYNSPYHGSVGGPMPTMGSYNSPVFGPMTPGGNNNAHLDPYVSPFGPTYAF